MDATTKDRHVLSKLFHVIHVCLSIGLVIMFVRSQMMSERRFKKLEDKMELITQEIFTTTFTDKILAENIQTRSTSEKPSIKRSMNDQTSETTRETKEQYVLNSQNSTKNLEDIATCLDLLNTFIKENKESRKGSMPKECEIFRGPPGKPGIRGRRGKRGAKGQAGHKGSTGKHGPPGPRGEKGFSGNVTVIGLKGDMGPKGTKGNKGDTGIKGQKGAHGPKGEFGGQKGEQGRRGDKGEVGPRGCRGDSFAPPSFVSTPQYLVFKEKDPAVLVCNATSNPYSRITWYRDNVPLPSQDGSDDRHEVTNKVIFQSGSNESSYCPVKLHPVTESYLIIKRSRSSDTGNYECEARNVMGVFRYKMRLLIQVYVKFTSVPPPNITVIENSDVQLICRASGVPPPVISWYRRKGGVMPGNFKIIQGDLHITRITKEQEGSYVCIASNVLGEKSAEANVTVYVFPVITHFQDHQVTVNEYQTLTLPCNAAGYPTPIITWKKINESFPKGRYKFDSQMLNISNVQYIDKGEYVCMANNAVGTALKRAKVVVQVGPKIQRKPNHLENGYRGKRKVLYFEVFAFPKANITWRRLDNMNMSKRFRQEAGKLVIEQVQYKDGGFYKATARNIVGEVKVTTFLVVKDPVSPWITSPGPPKIIVHERSSFSRTCSAKGIPSPKLVWKFNNKVFNSVRRHTNGSLTLTIASFATDQAGRYTCEATNRFGSATQHYDLVPPDVKVFVQSEGCDDRPGIRIGCGTCIIRVNDVEHCPEGRGHNIVVLNKYGVYQNKAVFDTYGSGNAGNKMKTFMEQLPNERIVIIAVKDSSNSDNVKAAAPVLRAIGAVNPTAVSLRSTWLLVGYKGGSQSWITENRADRRKGPSQATVKIPLPVSQ